MTERKDDSQESQEPESNSEDELDPVLEPDYVEFTPSDDDEDAVTLSNELAGPDEEDEEEDEILEVDYVEKGDSSQSSEKR